MREQTTTWQRSIAAARKLQPAVRQIENSLMFDCASTSQLGAFHHVYLGANRFNPLLDSKCDCGQTRYGCVHRASAFLQYTSNLETRCWKGCDVITQAEDMKTETEQVIQEMTDLFIDLLDRYERCCDLIRAIELGWDISNLRTAFKDRLPSTPDKSLQQQLLAKAVS